MNDAQLNGFIAVVRNGSLSRAAAEMFTTPQAIGQQMDRLEADVGARLLVRSPKGVTTTPAGRHFYEVMREVSAVVYQAMAECRCLEDKRSPVLRVGVLSTPLFIGAICLAFLKRYPAIEIEQVELNTDHDHELLLCGRIELAESGPFVGFERDDLRFVRLFDARPVCVLCKSHPLASRTLLELGDLKGHTVATANIDFFRVGAQSEDLPGGIDFVDRMFGPERILEFCLNGGVYVMPETASFGMRPLVHVPFQSVPMELGIHTRRDLSPEARLFVSFCRDFAEPSARTVLRTVDEAVESRY